VGEDVKSPLIQKTIAQWLLSCSLAEDKITFTVTHKDNSPVSDTDADIGAEGELGYRLTTRAIESDYKQNGEPNAQQIKESFTIKNWIIDLVNDDDNHLNIYVTSSVSDACYHLSSTSGTSKDKHCQIVVTDRGYMY